MQATQANQMSFIETPQKATGRRRQPTRAAGVAATINLTGSNKENIKPIGSIKKYDCKVLFKAALAALFNGAIKMKASKPIEALEGLNDVLAYDKTHLPAHLHLIEIYLSLNNLLSAYGACMRAVALFPDNPQLMALQAHIRERLNF